MQSTGLNMETVKKQNRASILNFVNAFGPVSRKDIAEKTGLTPAAVTQICNSFIQEGLLKELGTSEEASGAGRKKILVDIDRSSRFIICVSIENPETYISLVDIGGGFVDQLWLPTNNKVRAEEFLAEVSIGIDQLVRKNSKLKKKICGISITVPGIVDREKGLSLHAYGLWDYQVPVCDLLRNVPDLYNLPVVIENNVNALGIAELLYGQDKHLNDFFVIKWGPGVGSTILVNRQVYDGRLGKAAELGHYIVEKDGQLCNCGRRGCLETKVSYNALNAVKAFDMENFGSVFMQNRNLFTSQIDLFARAIVNSITILSPASVILCGKMFNSAEVRETLIECCKSYDERLDESLIKYTSLADKEDYIGPAASFVQSQVFI